ncbi:Flagellar hook protein FlgE [Thalassocella blandensis]|nr:Flagellar hook protein FlgE [Thalassocella blandensis]
MLQSFFNGLSGMFNFSKGLDNVSNNVANMNTPGFRGTDNFLRNVSGSNNEGYGTSLEGTSLRLASGEIRQTGNATDLALTGKGLFVLQDSSGEYFYTRAGQFSFNEDDVLIDSASQMEVMGISDSGSLETIDVTDFRIVPPVATSQVRFSGQLSTQDETHEISGISVIDVSGETQKLDITITRQDDLANTWTVSVADEEGNELGSEAITFNVDGSPAEGANNFDLNLDFVGVEQTVNFFFGEPGSFDMATQVAADMSRLGVNEVDGNPVLGLTRVEFNSKGILQFTYSNGDTQEGPQVAVASFTNEAMLEMESGAMFRSNASVTPEFGRAGSRGVGEIRGGSIELSNVDLTQEFADILIIQRGYQASSRVMSVSNELIEQLYENTRG